MRGKRKVKTRTLENHKGAAPKFILAHQGCATRLDVSLRRFSVVSSALFMKLTLSFFSKSQSPRLRVDY